MDNGEAHGGRSSSSILTTATIPPLTGPALGDWEPEAFERHGRELLAMIREHFESVRDVPVAVPVNPADLLKLVDSPLADEPEEFAAILADTREKIIPNLVQWNHPRFHGYFPTSASFPGVLAETLTAALNVNAMLWKTSPAASALERTVLRWVAGMVG
jgi:aromatic-L-amino-acid decarboxylase